MKVANETCVIMAIGLADLATTILFIQHHGAVEANPLFRWCWEMGLAVFIGAKIVLLVGPLTILEWARKHRPIFVSWALRGAIVAYLVMYGVGYFRLNLAPEPDMSSAELGAQRARMEPSGPGHDWPSMVKPAAAIERQELPKQTVSAF